MMKNSLKLRTVLILCSAMAFIACSSTSTRKPVETSEEALRLVTVTPEISDDLDLVQLSDALEKHIHAIRYNKNFKQFKFGSVSYSKSEYLLGLKRFQNLLREQTDRKALWSLIREEFDFYEVFGKKDWGEVLITSYYDPVIKGSRYKRGRFTQPLYKVPNDLVEVNLRQYGDAFKDVPSIVRGRVIKNKDSADKIVPYFDRAEIDEEEKLRRKKLELCYVDPMDAFILHIQGTGHIDLGNGQMMRVGYASQNGHRYEAVGKFLTYAIPIEEMSLQKIESYLRSLPEEQMQLFFNRNPSYVFFKRYKKEGRTSLGVPPVAGRTIASDRRYFPKGALAFLKFKKPKFKDAKQTIPQSWHPSARFVLDQDTGGAIKGTHRVDLFWGKGSIAKQAAGVMKDWGKLFYVAPKRETLKKLRVKYHNAKKVIF